LTFAVLLEVGISVPDPEPARWICPLAPLRFGLEHPPADSDRRQFYSTPVIFSRSGEAGAFRSFIADLFGTIWSILKSGLLTALDMLSHVASAVQQLCARTLWLDHGELIFDGDAGEVTAAYGKRSSTTC
jgi:hypothetical protein